MLHLFKYFAAVAVVFASLSLAAQPLFNIYKSKGKAYHLIIVLRDDNGAPTGIYFGREDELHERTEAYRLPPPRHRAEWSRVRLSLHRTLMIPPPGSAENLTLFFDNEGMSVEYAPAKISVVRAAAVRALDDEHLSAAFVDVGGCASVLRGRVEHPNTL